MKTFYLTTPLYYVNDRPHLGHAYTTILADVISRYHKMNQFEVFFLTGTDEHGQKIADAAQKRGSSPKEHCDEMAKQFKALWSKLNINYDDFIRTTQKRHTELVVKCLQKVYDKGDIYKSSYSGWYCIPDERFWTEKDLVDGKCPDCNREVVQLEEENYFFKMSKYQDWLIDYINDHPDFIQPETRKNEILGFLNKPLNDLCISRPKKRLSWGIPLPFDQDYVCYVWFDALINYITAPGYMSDEEKFKKWWPANYHMIGKDIVTTHGVFWPIMLKAMDVELPKSIFAHGWWLVDETKMSKSLGNVISPEYLVNEFGVDQFRYFLMREMALGQDASYSLESIIERINMDLANDFGNLASRTIIMIKKYRKSSIPKPDLLNEEDKKLIAESEALPDTIMQLIAEMKIHLALDNVMSMVRKINKYIEDNTPWKLFKKGQDKRLDTVLYVTVELLRKTSLLLYPVMPNKIIKLRKFIGANEPINIDSAKRWGLLKPAGQINLEETLFPRIEKETHKKPKKEVEEKQPIMENQITFEEFQKLDIRVAEVINAERVPDTKNLIKLEISLGEEKRTLVAGLAKYYEASEMAGKKIVMLANLKPARLHGILSEGMLLAAESKDDVRLLVIDGDLPAGSKIH